MEVRLSCRAKLLYLFYSQTAIESQTSTAGHSCVARLCFKGSFHRTNLIH
ncbi:unnamed protein product [Chondrus crispus]|uniref:Uncharacterized protein n=1 Tax=Chondrus crispus TaxID=2769 RepID=R7Q7D6_CHOCR|nr:unnamed protein product [Chondrus crispus]CDF33380.1 unnamed protein product [Chondrus crispus]|eukprot:XP_005713183.1 unnamed protein product [Chondrus crispus]